MRAAVSLVMLLGCAAVLAGQTQGRAATGQEAQPPAQQIQEEPKGSIEGVVRDTTTGQGLRNVVIRIARRGVAEPPVTSGTDDAGRYELTDIEPGLYMLFASREGYASPAGGVGRGLGQVTITVRPGDRLEDVDLELMPGAVVSGRVINEEGEPMIGVQVAAVQMGYMQGRRRVTPIARPAETNDLGEYRLHSLPAGRYAIQATARPRFGGPGGPFGGGRGARRGASRPADSKGYQPAFFPGVPDYAQAVKVELKPGQEVPGVDFTLRATRVVSIHGRAMDRVTGQPAAQAVIFAVPTEGDGLQMPLNGMTDSKGEFSIGGALPGSYTLNARTRGGGPEGPQSGGRVSVEVGEQDVEGLEVWLGPGVTIAGRVLVEGADSRAPLPPGFERLRVMLFPDQTIGFGGFMGGGSGAVDAQGAFSFTNVQGGRYRLNIQGMPRTAYLKAARLGDQEMPEQRVEIPDGASPGPMTVLISPNGARILGTVTDSESKPAPGAQVIALRKGAQDYSLLPDRSPQSQTDQFGAFTFEGLPPGEYQVLAFDRVQYGQFTDPEFIRKYESQAAKVELREAEQQSASLRLITLEDEP